MLQTRKTLPRNKARSQRQCKSDRKWYAPLRHPKRNLHTKFGIPTSNNIEDSDPKWYAPLRHPKRNQHTKFGIPTSNNIEDMLQTRLF